MSEKDNWFFEGAFNDIDEKAIVSTQFHPQCQNEEEVLPTKQYKLDNCKALSFAENNAFISKDDTINMKGNKLSCSNKFNTSRENLLLQIFEKNIPKEVSHFAERINKHACMSKEIQCSQSFKTNTISNLHDHNESRNEKCIKSANKTALDKEVKLVRIFPGPAGLITHKRDNDISVALHLNNIEKLENKTVLECNLSKSQDEKICNEKAWKFLLNDLPSNILKKYEISTIKNKANANHCDSMKIKFISGLLDYIDHSYDDPVIVLKDSTGSIEGTLHRDIPLNYPEILEPNVVILLHDVGLLKTTTNVVTNKYHILVSQVNLLAIYTNEGRSLCTSHMKNIISSISNEVELSKNTILFSKHCVASDNSDLQILDTNCDNTVLRTNTPKISINDSVPTSVNDSLLYQRNDKHKNHKQIFNKNENCKTTNEVSKALEHSMNIDDDISDFFVTESEFIVSDEPKSFNHSSSKTFAQSNEIQQRELQMWDINILDNTKKSVINLGNKIKEQNLSSDIIEMKNKICVVKSVFAHESSISSYDDVTHTAHGDSNLNVKSTQEKICNPKNSKNLINYFTDETFHDNEYDTDDEILSQLDVDNIFVN